VPGDASGWRALVGFPVTTSQAPGRGVRTGACGAGLHGVFLWCSRACVDAWASAASGGSFRAVTQVAVWGTALILRGRRVLYGKVPNNAYTQGSQELSVSAGAYRPGSLTDAQGPAVACPPRTPLCAPASYVPCIRSQGCTYSRKLTSRVVIITSLKYLRLDLLHKS
jgi:hypothetical protein